MMVDWAIVILTGVLVLVTAYYARQNALMVREMRRQNRPYLFITWKPRGGHIGGSRLVLRNGGTRVAQDVRVALSGDVGVWRHVYAPAAMNSAEKKEFALTDLPETSAGIPSVAPDGELELGFLEMGQLVTGKPHSLTYALRYQDGGGVEYVDSSTVPYPGI